MTYILMHFVGQPILAAAGFQPALFSASIIQGITHD
jgi:hypothetical protein